MVRILRFACTVLPVFLLVGVLATAAGSAEPTTTQIAEKALPAVVVIQAGDALGSGVLVDATGTVLSCFHVVDGAKSALVKLSNGGYFPAQGLSGFNRQLDIAVVKCQGRDLPYLDVGDSSKLKPGDRVVAIGSPRGLQNTVSEGIVSAIRRVGDCPENWKTYLLSTGRKEDDQLIQFTAPISPGNSGGPLIDANGNVVGIVILRDPSKSADNIYFAVPVDEAKQYLDSKTVTKFEEVNLEAIGGGRKRAGVGSKELGLDAPVAKDVDFTIPKGAEPVYAVEPGVSVDIESVSVSTAVGGAFKRTNGSPGSREYKVLADGGVLFSPQDKGQRVKLSMTSCPRRVAVLPVVNTSNLDYMPTAMRDSISSCLSGMGFIIAPDAEVAAVVRENQLNFEGAMYGIGDSLSAENVTKLADELNVALIVLGKVDAASSRGSASCSVVLLVFDGRTGKAVLTKAQRADKNTSRFSGQRSAKERLVRGIVQKMLKEHFGGGKDGGS